MRHPKYAYIMEAADDRLRGKDLGKLIAEIVQLFLAGRYEIKKAADIVYFAGEGFSLSRGRRQLITTFSGLYRLFEVAWEEYQKIPLIKALG